MILHVTKRITVSEILSSRYEPGKKPHSWDKRLDGFDIVKTTEDEIIALDSKGAQSSPDQGWNILLSKDNGQKEIEKFGLLSCFAWRLYGLK